MWTEKGLHTNQTSSEGACLAALQTQRPKVSTKDGLKLKLINQKRFMVGSRILGSNLP